MKKNVVFYANCQGIQIWCVLRLSKIFMEFYEDKLNYITNYHHLYNKTELNYSLIQQADLFIYQPIDKKHGVYSTDLSVPGNVLSYCKPSCVLISFPYIYQSAMWSLIKPAKIDDLSGGYGNYDKYVNREVILALKKKGLTLKQVLQMWDQNSIDFNYQSRYENNLQILREKEALTDIKVSDFIDRHIHTKFLFLTQNHPTSPIIVHCVNQIFKKLKIDDELELFNLRADFGYEKPQKGWPVSKYDIQFWKFEYKSQEDSNATNFYKDIIKNIWNQ